MKIKKIPLILFVFITIISAELYCQSSLNFLNGFLISFKGGYHTEDNENSYSHIPDGFTADGTLEYHSGKNWYIGVNGDLSFGTDVFNNIERSIVVFSYTPILKYRFFIKNASLNIGAGFGASSVTINGYNNNNMLNLNLRTGIDLMLSKKLSVSAEAVYYEIIQRKNDGGRTNQMASVKLGLSYFIENGK